MGESIRMLAKKMVRLLEIGSGMEGEQSWETYGAWIRFCRRRRKRGIVRYRKDLKCQLNEGSWELVGEDYTREG